MYDYGFSRGLDGGYISHTKEEVLLMVIFFNWFSGIRMREYVNDD